MTTSAPTSRRMNRHYLTLGSFSIDPRYLEEPRVGLGDGISLHDPLRPEVAPYRAFEQVFGAGAMEGGMPKSEDIIQETTVLRESLTQQQEASVLSAYFKASYMLSSVQGAYETAKTEQNSYHSIYALLEHSGEAVRLNDKLLVWRQPPVSEAIADSDEALLDFIGRYGSHYVSAIRYGLRIGIQGKLSTAKMESVQSFSTSFKASFGSFSAEAGVRNQQKQKLEQMSVDLLLEATSGGHSGALLVMRGFDDIAEFLDRLKKGEIQFTVAPIELILKPYWPTLHLEWVNIRAALDPSKGAFAPPGALYGVPKGTILAWRPTSDYVKGLEVEAPQIVAPDGWAICDGTRGTPDLRHRFLFGTAGWTPAPIYGGSDQHNHGGSTGGNTEKRGAHGGAGSSYHQPAEVHTHPITPDKHLPPYVEAVFIMKLDDLP